jgi:hypothetical protein
MKTINIKPVQIIGSCPAGLTLADRFQIVGMRLENPGGSKICFLALSQIPIGQGIWQIQSEERFFSHVSCPGCIPNLERENRVVFLLGHADKWELCQIISEYLRLCKQHEEPELALKLKVVAIQQQDQGEYSAATQTMKAALEEFMRGIV